jgi:hypothetical protein
MELLRSGVTNWVAQINWVGNNNGIYSSNVSTVKLELLLRSTESGVQETESGGTNEIAQINWLWSYKLHCLNWLNRELQMKLLRSTESGVTSRIVTESGVTSRIATESGVTSRIAQFNWNRSITGNAQINWIGSYKWNVEWQDWKNKKIILNFTRNLRTKKTKL